MLVLTSHQKSTRLINGFHPNPDFHQDLRIRAFAEGIDRDGAALDIFIGSDDECATDEILIGFLAAVWKGLALSQVHTLTLQNIGIVTQKSWSRFLRSLPSLRILDITGRAPSGLVWALLLDARSHRGDGDNSGLQRLLVPRLNDIYLHQVDCSSGGFMVKQDAPVNSHTDLDNSPFLDVLTRCLAQRRRLGLCLRSLSLARCEYALRASVEAARMCVIHVICDLRNVKRDLETCPSFLARYPEELDIEDSSVRHYHRLRTLVQLDAET
jgi:hypothetical protein